MILSNTINSKNRILVVDDHPALVTLTRHKLVQKGYEVITAQNGSCALELALREYPDLIISDVEMPLMDGFDLCKGVKAHPELKKVPVILVTSMVKTDHVMKGIVAGADNYLTKPYDDNTLFAQVEELLNNAALPALKESEELVEITIEGKIYQVKNNFSKIIHLFLSTYKNTLAQNQRLDRIQNEYNNANQELQMAKKEHEDLLQNIFPKNVAESLIAYGNVSAERFDDVSIMFTDFDDFSKVVPKLSPEELIECLSHYFDEFDEITERFNLTKIKTIGDSYMAAAGLPDRNETHPIDTILAALNIQKFISGKEKLGNSKHPFFRVRIGIHTGPAVVGVIGKRRFAYDMWGEAVNLASRMEQNSANDQINITEETYNRVKEFFVCEPRGDIEAKNIGSVTMYFVKRIKPEFSEDEAGFEPNRLFIKNYNVLSRT